MSPSTMPKSKRWSARRILENKRRTLKSCSPNVRDFLKLLRIKTRSMRLTKTTLVVMTSRSLSNSDKSSMPTKLRFSIWKVSWGKKRMRICSWRRRRKFCCKILLRWTTLTKCRQAQMPLLSTNNRSLNWENRSRSWKERVILTLMTTVRLTWWCTEDSTRIWKLGSNSSAESLTGTSLRIAS